MDIKRKKTLIDPCNACMDTRNQQSMLLNDCFAGNIQKNFVMELDCTEIGSNIATTVIPFEIFVSLLCD